MPSPFHQGPDNGPWPVPLPGAYDPNQPNIPGTMTIPHSDIPSGSGVPIPSRPVSPVGGLPNAVPSVLGNVGATSSGITALLGSIARFSPLIATVLGYALSRRGDQPGMDPEQQALLNRILQQQSDRFEQTGPLHAATMSGIYQFLPNFAQQGGASGLGLGGSPNTNKPNVPDVPGSPPPGGGRDRARPRY